MSRQNYYARRKERQRKRVDEGLVHAQAVSGVSGEWGVQVRKATSAFALQRVLLDRPWLDGGG